MPNGRDSRRVRGSDGKLYDPEKQADNGHRAHENRAQTVARRTKWRSKGAARSVAGGLSTLGSGLFTMLLLLVVRPVQWGVSVAWRGLSRVTGWLGSLVGRSNRRSSRSRGRR